MRKRYLCTEKEANEKGEEKEKKDANEKKKRLSRDYSGWPLRYKRR